MPPLEYSWEIRERAKELYVVDGLSYEEAAAALAREFPAPTPIAKTLKDWSADEKQWAEDQGNEGKSWFDQRKDFVLALSSIRRDSVLLRAKLIGNALGEPEFKKVLSAAMWEKTQQGKDAQAGKPAPLESQGVPAGTPAPLSAAQPIRTPQEAVAGLEEALAGHLQAMLAGLKPITLKALKDFKDCVALVEELKTKYRPAEGEAPEETDESRRRLVEEVNRILGVK